MEPRDTERRRRAQAPSTPADEPERLAELHGSGLLDMPPLAVYDRITRSVSGLLGVPIALVSLVDEDRQWFLSRCGLEVTETSRELSFCGRAVAARQTLKVADASRDPRFAGSPLVIGEPRVRAYLGVPLISDEGHALGTLCVMDRRVREFSAAEQNILERYAKAVQHLMRR